MKTIQLFPLVAVIAAAVLATACDAKQEVSSPNCVGMGKDLDAAQREEFAKKCPRVGPAFKPSEKKGW